MFSQARAVNAHAAIRCPLIQLGAENNIEKSRCLAQMRKKIFKLNAIGTGFSGFRACEGLDSRRNELLRSL
jgi:hypothetical protein